MNSSKLSIFAVTIAFATLLCACGKSNEELAQTPTASTDQKSATTTTLGSTNPAARPESSVDPKEMARLAKEKLEKQAQTLAAFIANGTAYAGGSTLPVKAKKIDIKETLLKDRAVVETNGADANLINAFDGIEKTLTRTTGTNPLQFTVKLPPTTKVRAVRVLSTFSDYGWSVATGARDRLFVEQVKDGEWSTIVLPRGVKAEEVTIQVVRKTRDNNVHVNEIEIYSE